MVKKLILKIIDLSYYAIIPLLIVGISKDYTSFQIALIALIVLVLFNNRHTVGVFLIMYGGSLGGITRTIYPNIPVYGALLIAIGFILVWDLLLEFIKTHWPSLLWLSLLLAIFGVFYFLGPRDEFSNNKYSSMCIHASLMLIGYYVFNQSKTINAESMVRLLLLGSICMIAFVILYYNFSSGDLFDYDWFRDQSTAWSNEYDENTIVTYQHIGMSVVFGIAIWLSQTRLPLVKTMFYLVCATQLVLTSGCRQAMLGLYVVVVLRFVVFRLSNNSKNNRISKIKIKGFNGEKTKKLRIFRNSVFVKFVSFVIGSVVAYFVFIFAVSHLASDIDIISQTLDEGDLARTFLFSDALAIFNAHKLFGVGLGGFHAITGEVWPHNFFLELLCETGLVGTLLVFLIAIINMIFKHVGLFHVTNSKMFYFLVLSALFVRVMVSSELTESIELFSAVFAISTVTDSRITLTHNTLKFK